MINPKTGKRYGWEAEQAARKAAEPDLEEVTQRLGLLKRAQRAQQAREKFMPFVKFTSPDPADPNDVDKSRYQNARHHDAIARVVEEVVNGGIRFLILTMPPRHGKQLAHETPVPTPAGYVRHGDLRPGDTVFGPDGQPVKVLAISPEAPQDVEIEFTNGEIVRCHEKHEWTVRDRRSYPPRMRTLETRDLEHDVWIGKAGARGGRARWQLPDADCLSYPSAVQPLHPYALGVWLGDGATTKPHITGVDEEVFDAAAACSGFHETGRWVHKTTGVTTVAFSGPRPNVRGQLSAALHALGLVNIKFIPPQYLRASREQRLQLLAGLMDTDGHVEHDTGRCRFVTGDERLADDVFTLASGLGFRPYVMRQQPGLSTSGIQGRREIITVGFQPTEAIPTRLERKRVLKFGVRRRVAIKSIRRVAPHMGRCIQVDRPDGLYIVGRKHVVTHNSELVSRRLPAWFIGKFPHQNGVVATYNDDFAADFGKDVRTIVSSPQFKQVFPGVRLQRGGAASDFLKTTEGGQWAFVGRRGSLTGRGAHLAIMDDLIKDDKEAQSQTIRDEAWNFFTKVVMTRRMGLKLVIMTFTRWHSDDPIGRLTDPENPYYNENLARKIKIINLPAIAEEDDPLGREPGEALWPDGPDKFDLEFLEEQRSIDALGFEALYQQHPSLLDGELYRRETIKFYGPGTGVDLPANLRYYAASDHALDSGRRHDPSCLLKIGVDKNSDIYILDCIWKKMPTDVAVEAMLAMMRDGTPPLLWWAEKGHISKSIGPFLRKRMLETGTYINIVEVTPVSDKGTRAQSMVGRVAMGKVYFPKGAWWTEKAINEMMAFPNGTHDDFCDTLSLFGLGLQNQFAPSKSVASAKIAAPAFGTLAWVRQADTWRERQRAERTAGGF